MGGGRQKPLRQFGNRDVRPDIDLHGGGLEDIPRPWRHRRFAGLGKACGVWDRDRRDGDLGLGWVCDLCEPDGAAGGGGPAVEAREDEIVDARGVATLWRRRHIVGEIDPHRQGRPVVQREGRSVVRREPAEVGLIRTAPAR